MKRRFFNKFALIALVGAGFLTSCSTEPEPTAELPAATGTVDIKFLNFPGTGEVTTTAASGDMLAVAVEVLKSTGGNRPQKLRVYATNTKNTRGTQVGTTIDLRNTDEAQIKNINYTVPNQSGPVYLYFEVDESASAFSRKLLIINIGGTAGVSSYPNVTLGAQTNTAPSRIASATGQLYKACDAAANINDIDITYASLGTLSTPTLLSNPERAVKGLSTTATNCGTNASSSTAGGPNTLFIQANTTESFNNATDATLSALSFVNARESVAVAVGDVIAFKTEDGRNGLIRIEDLTTGTAGTIRISVKVQR
jgi:hypothetical protein